MKFAFLLASVFFFSNSYAQKVEVDDDATVQTPVTGRKAAQKYFQERKRSRSPASAGTSAPHYLALHVGKAFNESSNKWGNNNADDVGRLNLGVTYRIGEWTNSMDFMFRADLFTYSLVEGNAIKLSLLPMLVFPDASSRFPLYFGAGIGPGIFLKQIRNESALSLDWQLVAGARFFDVVNTMGFMFEVGMKNHFLLTSDGQYQSVFAALGVVFAF